MSAITTQNESSMSEEEIEKLKAADIERLRKEIGITEELETSENKKQTKEEQEKSLQWLRDRGIEVETPEDRKRAKDIASSMSKLSATDDNTRSFTYVKIPADSNLPIVEMVGVVYNDSRGNGDQLLNILKSNFSTGTVDAAALKKVAESTHLGNEGSSDALKKVTPASIASGGGAVETFRLAEGIQLYLDAVGALKSLPANERAAGLARQCGYGDVPLFGDMYVGRMDTLKGTRVNGNFMLSELESNQKWLQEAASQNLKRQEMESSFRSGGMSSDEINSKGGKGDGYEWKQTTEEVEVSVPLPEGTRGKQCKVKFGRRSLSIVVNTDGGPTLKFDNLYGKVSQDECLWTISDGVLVVTMEKAKAKEVWPTLDA
jgi:hypothetical protein